MYPLPKALPLWWPVIVLALTLAGCRGDEPKRMPDTLPDITGMITQLQEAGKDAEEGEIQLLVEAPEDNGTNAPKASIKIDKNTLIETKGGARIKAGQLKPGLQVEVWYRDKVMETMPVQAEAKALRVLTRTLKKD